MEQGPNQTAPNQGLDVMDYRYLKAFLLTAKHASFSKAATELKIAQSAVSRQIKLLEETLGVELIIRSSKKVILTDKGRELYMAAMHFDKVAIEIFTTEDDRPLKIGVLHGLLENWLNPLLIKFYKKYKRNIAIHVDTPENLQIGLSEGKFDLLFTIENIQSDLISSLKLFDERLVLISREPIDRKKLEEYRWIVYNDGDNLFKLTKKKSESLVTVDSITTIVNLVKNNVGIAVVPDHAVKKSDNLYVEELKEIKKSEIFMSTLNYRKLPEYIREFSELVKKSLS